MLPRVTAMLMIPSVTEVVVVPAVTVALVVPAVTVVLVVPSVTEVVVVPAVTEVLVLLQPVARALFDQFFPGEHASASQAHYMTPAQLQEMADAGSYPFLACAQHHVRAII